MKAHRATILLTRPARASERFARALEVRLRDRVRVLVSPILRIEPDGRLPDLGAYRTVIFTSENGVHAVDAPRDARLAYCVGDRTAEAADAAGYRAVSASGDAAALERRLLADRPPGPWIHLVGAHQRGNLAETLSAAGHPTDQAVVYRQIACGLSQEAADELRAGSVILPVFSPRSAALLCAAMPSEAEPPAVVAISDATAASWTTAARTVRISLQPDADSMLAAIEEAVEADSPC